jgi:hypothetical protein
MRLRSSGTDSSAITDYNNQRILANSTTVSGERVTNGGWWECSYIDSTWREGFTGYLFGPYLSQPTAYRSVTASGYGGASFKEGAGTHELSSSYDGITFIPSGDSSTGLVSVYGLVGA